MSRRYASAADKRSSWPWVTAAFDLRAERCRSICASGEIAQAEEGCEFRLVSTRESRCAGTRYALRVTIPEVPITTLLETIMSL